MIPALIRWLFVGKVKVYGKIPKGQWVIASNHTSWADMFILSLFAPKMMAHPIIMRILDPLTFGSFTRLGCFEANLTEMENLLETQSVAICPEGWAYCDGVYTRPFRWGAIVASRDSEKAIIPIYIEYGWYPGDWINLIPNRWLVFLVCAFLQLFLHRGVTVKIGEPDIFDDPKDLRFTVVKLSTDVQSLQEEMLEVLDAREMTIDELVREMKERHKDKLTFDVRSAILPLLSSGELEMNKFGKLKASSSEA